MNEYVVYYLNGITAHILAEDWKDAIDEGKINAQRKGFSEDMKYIMDEDNTIIKYIDNLTGSFKFADNKEILKTLI